MIDIQVKNLVKFFTIGENLLDGLSFDIQEGERVAILGRNGCGKTTLFKILTGEMDYDDGEVFINPNKRLGLISQIPKFPAGYTVEDVLRSAYADLYAIQKKMGTLWLISDTIPVGVFSLTEENFGDLYIRPDCQGRGYGTACIRFAMETMPRLRLTVFSDNRAAIALYEKMNFRFTGNDALLRDGLWEREMVYTEN